MFYILIWPPKACWYLPDAWWDMTYGFDHLPAGCRVQAGVNQQTAVLPAAWSHCVLHRALWWDRLLPPATLPHHPPPAPPHQAVGQGPPSYVLTVWCCWSRTTLTGWGLKRVVATVSVGRTGSGVGRWGQHHAAGRWHHHGKPGSSPVVHVPRRNTDQENVSYGQLQIKVR